ncbi:hypothetical protein ABPG75_011463 [Micractinium tetrahymenae]
MTEPAGQQTAPAEPPLEVLLAGVDPAAVDLLLSTLAAAAASYRRATCTVPFPSALFESPDGRDYAALSANLQALPPVEQLAAAAAAGRLSTAEAALLRWALTRPRRPAAGIRRCMLRAVQEQLPSMTGWLADIGHNPSLRPQAALQLSAVPPALAAGDARTRVLAFHGTSMENVWSILHNGLLNASGTRLERTGAAFGKGIYFSTELPVAFSFSQPADGWVHSALGRRVSCVLVCSIDREHAQGAHNSAEVPDRYIICERMDAVQMHFLFLYRDDALPPTSPLAAAAAAAAVGAGGVAHPQQLAQAAAAHVAGTVAAAAAHRRLRISPLLLVLLAYGGWLLYVWTAQNWPFLRRLLRRQLGIRL